MWGVNFHPRHFSGVRSSAQIMSSSRYPSIGSSNASLPPGAAVWSPSRHCCLKSRQGSRLLECFPIYCSARWVWTSFSRGLSWDPCLGRQLRSMPALFEHPDCRLQPPAERQTKWLVTSRLVEDLKKPQPQAFSHAPTCTAHAPRCDVIMQLCRLAGSISPCRESCHLAIAARSWYIYEKVL